MHRMSSLFGSFSCSSFIAALCIVDAYMSSCKKLTTTTNGPSIWTHMHTCSHGHAHTHAHVCTWVCTHTHAWAYPNMYTMNLDMHVPMHACTHMYKNMHMQTHTHTQAHLHECKCAHVCASAYTCKHTHVHTVIITYCTISMHACKAHRKCIPIYCNGSSPSYLFWTDKILLSISYWYIPPPIMTLTCKHLSATPLYVHLWLCGSACTMVSACGLIGYVCRKPKHGGVSSTAPTGPHISQLAQGAAWKPCL